MTTTTASITRNLCSGGFHDASHPPNAITAPSLALPMCTHEAHAATRLPTELLYLILNHLGSFRDIANCALIHSTWKDRTLDYLYRKDAARNRYAMNWALLRCKPDPIQRMKAIFGDPFHFEDLATAIAAEYDEAADAVLASKRAMDEWRRRPQPEPATDKRDRSPLVAAVAHRNHDMVKKILAVKGVAFENPGEQKLTALRVACVDRVKALAAIIQDYKGITSPGKQKWYKYAKSNLKLNHNPDLGIIKALLDAGLGHDACTSHPWDAPLYLAATLNRVDIMNLLVVYGLPVNPPGEYLPLLAACRHNHIEAVQFLLEHGADVRRVGIAKSSVLHETTNPKIAEMLLANGMPIDFSYHDMKPGQNRGDFPDRTPLQDAIEQRRLSMAAFLLEQGADPSKVGAYGSSNAIVMAARNGLEDMVPTLYRTSFDPYETFYRGFSTLDSLVMMGKHAVVKTVVELGADFTRSNATSYTYSRMRRMAHTRPICLARDVSMINLLAEHSGSLNDRIGENGATVFHGALVARREQCKEEDERRETIRRFVELGANLEMATDDGWTALHYALSLNDEVCAGELIKLGANIHAADAQGRTPLLRACTGGKPEVVQVLLDAGAAADINTTDPKGTTPLMEACQWGHNQVVKILIVAGADIHATKPSEEEPTVLVDALAMAVGKRCGGSIRLLLEAGEDVERIIDEDIPMARRLRKQRHRAQLKKEKQERRRRRKVRTDLDGEGLTRESTNAV